MNNPQPACNSVEKPQTPATLEELPFVHPAKPTDLHVRDQSRLHGALCAESSSSNFGSLTLSGKVAAVRSRKRESNSESASIGTKFTKTRLISDGGFQTEKVVRCQPSLTSSQNQEYKTSPLVDDVKTVGITQAISIATDQYSNRPPEQDRDTIAASLDSLAKLPSDTLFPSPLPPLSSVPIRKDAKPKHLCSVCGKVFKRAHNLKIHGRLHSGDKPYGCPFSHCEKEFRWKSSIVSHLNWHKTKMGEILAGFDGTAAGYDAHSNSTSVIPEKVNATGSEVESKSTSDSGQVAANFRLEKALLLQSHAQARQTAALQAAGDAIAAANEAAEEAASAADAAAECERSRLESATGNWPVPQTSKKLSSSTSQHGEPLSLSSANNKVVSGLATTKLSLDPLLFSSNLDLFSNQSNALRSSQEASNAVDVSFQESLLPHTEGGRGHVQDGKGECPAKVQTYDDFFPF